MTQFSVGTPSQTIAVWAENREALIEFVKGFIPEGIPGSSVIAIDASTLPCGTKVSYETLDDIPQGDVPCPCGDPTHFLIKYG